MSRGIGRLQATNSAVELLAPKSVREFFFQTLLPKYLSQIHGHFSMIYFVCLYQMNIDPLFVGFTLIVLSFAGLSKFLQ